jgi:hypothetical protein
MTRARAKAAYEEGASAFARGDYRRAAESFEAAHKLLPHHSNLWNAGQAWMKAGEDVRAANMLERFLNEAPADAPDRNKATQAIRDLEKRLGRIEVVANNVTDVKVDGNPMNGTRLWVVPGEHVATGEADGKPIRKPVSVAAGDRVSVTLEVVVEAPPPPPPVSHKPLPPWLFFLGAGATTIAAGVTIASGLDTFDKRDAFQQDRSSQAKLDVAKSSRDRTNMLIVTSAALGVVTGVIFFLTDWSGSSPPSPQTGGRSSAPFPFVF